MASLASVAGTVSSCSNEYLYTDLIGETTCSFNFNVSVASKVCTRSQYSVSDQISEIDPDVAFGLIGSGMTNRLVIDNEEVYEYAGRRSANITVKEEGSTTLNAYYPHTASVDYHADDRTYLIMYSSKEIEKGAKISNSVTMARSASEPSDIDLEFHDITNKIGFTVEDITSDSQLQGHVHVRKVIAYGVATEGLYHASVDGNDGWWSNQNERRSFVMFEGDCNVIAGTPMYVSGNSLSYEESDCSTIFAVPEEIRQGVQFVRVVFDVEPFESEGCICTGIENLVQDMAVDGVLPDNKFIEGKKYIFNIGLDMNTVFKKIDFTAQVSQWQESVSGGSVITGSLGYTE